MPPPQYNADHPIQPGTSEFPLPIHSSSPSSGANEGDSTIRASHDPDRASNFPSFSFSNGSTNRKRRPETSTPSLSAETMVKSRRTTPSPALTGDTTPGSFESFDFLQDPHLAQFLGGNPQDHLAEQKAQERELQGRMEQERLDAEFARQLAEQSGYQPPPRLSVPPPRTSQSFLDSTREIRRPHLPAPPVLLSQPSPQSGSTFSTPQISGLSPSFRTPKKESFSPNPPQSFDNVIDLGSDDDDEPVPPSASATNGDDSHGTNVFDQLWEGNFATNVPDGTLATTNSMNPFDVAIENNGSGFDGLGGNSVGNASHIGGYNAPASSNWADRMNDFSQSLANAARGVFTSTSDIFDENIASYPTITPGPYEQPLLQSSSGVPVIDLESDDDPQRSIAEDWYPPRPTRSLPWLEDSEDRYMARVSYLQNDPTKTTAEIKDLLENIRPDEDLPEEYREHTPEAMAYPLMKHQVLGLAWMKAMEQGSNKGGILADDMGLGKTIQALALMVTRRSSDPTCKTTLVVAPLALMKQWEREIKSKLKNGREHQLTTYTLHGQGRGASWAHLRTYDVVLTTYGTLSTEMKRKESINGAKQNDANWRPTTKADRLPLLGDECKWYRIILDEAQCIKNRNTKAAQGACALQAQTRFCMSGTPMQNGVIELYSLVHFLRIKPYDDIHRFNMDFTKPLKSMYEGEKNRGMQKLQALLKAILLRRNKKSIIDGQPILSLPERTTESRHAEFSEDEQAFYSALENRVQLQFNKYLRAGTVGRNYSNVLVLLLRLRQACCHPHLIKDIGMSAEASHLPGVDLVKMAKELAPDVVARIIDQGDLNDQSGLECPVCMDATENATIFIPCGHNTCSECFAKISDPSQAIANGDDGGNNLKCPHCRGKISASRVTDHATFKKVHIGGTSAEEELAGELLATLDSESETDDDSTEDEGSDLAGFVVDDGEDSTDGEGYRKGNTPFERCSKKSRPKKEKAKEGKVRGKGKDRAEEKPPKKTLAQLKKESLRNMKARKKYVAHLRKTWEASAKIEKTIEILQGIQDSKEGEKTIIFSQFTSLLDLLEIPIYDKGWVHTRYDGSMSATARNDAVLEFQDKPECKIMLVSLRAGNSGLNLVAASQVIIMDPFWNPYVEEQAIDRAHRIGQQRPVQVHRILVPGTVEDRILSLQEKKRAMIESALDENASRQVGRLGIRELGYLFVSIRMVVRQGR